MFYIQDPFYADSKQLLDAILECCSSAQSGAGAYAFVSADGTELLIGDPIFTSFLERGQFLLIIGMDEITNSHSLNALNHYVDLYPNLQVMAFLHNTTGSVFHPKFCWFDCGDYGYVITGSGNLTQKGMQRNREAFDAKKVSSVELATVVQYWNTWLDSVKTFLFPLDAEAVIQRAEENIRRMQANRPPRKNTLLKTNKVGAHKEQVIPEDFLTKEENIEPECYVDDEYGAWEYDAGSTVLICEITRGTVRWNQANFDANTFRTFFESTPGVAGQKALILRNVKSNGSMGEVRRRPPVSVASHNYRIELYVDSGTTYHPDDGRVLGIFIKLSSRTFLYSLIFPTDVEYSALQVKLDSERQRHNRLVRYQTNAEELQRLAPSLPILQYLSQVN